VFPSYKKATGKQSQDEGGQTMTDFRERVFKARDENALKRLASRIPGYGGYLEKEMRRDADKLLREYIARQIEEQRKRLSEAQADLLELPGGLDLMDEVERLQKKMQLLIDRLRTAVYGYAGWFDAVTIREKELDALYNYDAALLDGVDQIAAGVQTVVHAVAGDGEVKPAVVALKQTLNGLNEQMDRRKDVLTGATEVPPPPAEPTPPPVVPTPPPVVPTPPPATDTNTGS
jgi:ATP phosphoribosyltransferase regulatory subunit HisZ